MRCCGDIGAELLGVDLDALFSTPATFYTYTPTEDQYGGRGDAWARTTDTMVHVANERPGVPLNEGETKRAPGATRTLLVSLTLTPIRNRDKFLIGTDWLEVLEVQQAGSFDFYQTVHTAKVPS